MKFLKKYENNKNDVWIVCCEYTKTPDGNHHHLFYNKKHAIECYLTIVNDLKNEINNSNVFDIISEEDADKWMEEYGNPNINAYYYKKYISHEFEMPEELKIKIDSAKYNI